MPRSPWHRIVWTVLAITLATGCSDSGGEGDPNDLVAATDALYPDDATGEAAVTLAGELVDAAGAGDEAGARASAFDLAELTLTEYRGGRLQGTPASLPGTLATYFRNVFAAAGLPRPDLSAPSFGDEGIVAVLRPAGGTFTSQSLRAGLEVPAGALTEPVLLVATRIADSGAFAPGDGPLPTTFPQWPLFYDFSLTPDATLAADGIIGLCQVTEPGSAWYVPDPVFATLRLAHPDPNDVDTIELLDRVEAPFLECDGVTTGSVRTALAIARRAGIGGRVRKFSPFAAVAPSGSLGDGLLGPTPYLGFQDSPFNGLAFPGYFHFEDWEDHAINTPGVTASSTALGSSFGASLIDSVDDDDGTVDGACVKPDGTCDSGFAGGSISFTFDAAALGALPTHVGVAWTDGGGGITVTFEAYDANDVLIDSQAPGGIGDGANTGGVDEDRFFGIVASGGIKRIVLSNSGGGIEVDHLQYGR